MISCGGQDYPNEYLFTSVELFHLNYKQGEIVNGPTESSFMMQFILASSYQLLTFTS